MNYYFNKVITKESINDLVEKITNTEGKINLSKALCYKPRSLFMWFYYVVGQIIGYVRLESAFQYRLSKLKTQK